MKRLHIVEEKFLNTIKKYNLIKDGDVIVIGVSGGPDSITLLSCMNKYKEKFGCKIIVAHINHMIRKDAKDDELYVKNMCEKLNLKFYSKSVDVEELAKKEKKGTEEIGRKVRYDFFDEISKKENANKIAIAHNMNDNAETMILNLIRGTGLNGLEGIQPVEYNKYIRPLIYCERSEIEDYCKINNLQPHIDSTNKENIYKRNIIRNEFIPKFKKLNPSIIETLSRTSIIAKENNDFIKNITLKQFDKICEISEKTVSIKLVDYNKLDKPIKQNIILMVTDKLFKTYRNIDKNDIDKIIELASNNVGNKHLMINKHYKFEIKNRKLIFIKI